MKKEEITKAKFEACVTNYVEKYTPFAILSKKSLEDFDLGKFDFNEFEMKEFDLGEFNDIMKKFGLEEYTILLFHYYKSLVELNHLESLAYSTEFDFDTDNYRLDILKTIQFLINKTDDLTISVFFHKSKDKHSIKSQRLVSDIEDYIISLFNNQFKEMYSDEEADLQLRQAQNETWASNWLNSYSDKEFGTRVAHYSDIKDNKIYKYNNNEDITGVILRKDILRSFKLAHFKSIEFSIERIDKLINEFGTRVKKPNSDKRKNLARSIILREIADLLRVNEYISSTTIVNIDDIKLKDDDLRVIYAVLHYWDLLPIREKNSSTPEKYLRTILNETKNYPPAEYYNKRRDRLVKLKTEISPLFLG